MILFTVASLRICLADHLLCLTTNGLVRWKLYLEPIGNMINMGTSNVVSNRRGDVFFTTSWTNHSAYSAKVCHLTNVETSQPVQRCVENYQLYANFHTPLAINDASVYLFTTVFDQAIQQVPAVIGIDTLGIVWIDRGVVGAAPDSEYNDDGTGIYWIGDDNHFIKVNGADTRLLNVNMPSGGNRYYAFDRYHAKIVKAWQNGSEITAPLVVSGWDALASGDFRLLWQWAQPRGDFTRCTQPVINDQTGITYIASLPYLFAINMNGIIFWQAEIVSQSEIKTFNLVSTCLALNTETKIIYIVIASTSAVQPKQSSTLFIATAHMDTGAVLKRININVPSNTTITPNCPMLIGNDMLYISWLEGNFPNLVPLNIMGLPQLNSNETPK